MYNYTSGYKLEELSIQKGRVIGGLAIGIIVFGEGGVPLVPGNVGNATTFSFPVYYKAIEAATAERVVSTKPDPLVLKELIEAGKELERQGCRAITSDCGYFANYLPEVAAALNIPTFLSSLMQVPMIIRALKPSQKVGIICANSDVLRAAPALKNCGINDLSSIVIAGAEDLPEMQNILQSTGRLNPGKFEQELVGLAKETVNKNPDIGALLLECAEMPTYAWAIQEAVRLPVFDFTTMINWVYSAVVRRPFAGFI
ncbi:MAG: aspartate/glutamate racemase family protein [Desulfobacteraceae bacterium]|nr:aspartate/glutamate racemase family protein [Desulfobacteraceae bacterium]